MVNAILSNLGLSEGFQGEAMLTIYYILNKVPNKRNSTPYELWNKRKPSPIYFRVSGCRAIVRVPKPKKRKVDKEELRASLQAMMNRAKSKFMVIEPNASIMINTMIE